MLRTLWKSRYLVRELILRDLRNRYRGSILGGLWSIVNPLVQLMVYTLVFSGFLRQSFDESGSNASFALVLFAALLPWLAFQETLNRSARSFIEHAQLIKRTRFPLPALPLSIMVSAFLHQCVGTALLLAVLLLRGEVCLSNLLLWPLAVLLELLLVFGLSLTLACVTVLIRDMAQALGAIFLILFWTTPIVYPHDKAGSLGWVLDVNPLTHLVGLYRYCFFDQPIPGGGELAYLAGAGVLAFLIGSFAHSRTRRLIVDLV